MEPRRPQRGVTDPKVRQVGFVPTATSSAPLRSSSEPSDSLCSASPPVTDLSLPPGNSLSPVMIPPARHASAPVPVPGPPPPPLPQIHHHLYSASEISSPSSSRLDSTTDPFPDDLSASPASPWISRAKTAASSLPANSSEMMVKAAAAAAPQTPKSNLTTASIVKTLPGFSEKGSVNLTEIQNEGTGLSKPLQKMTKADRRALQESQRAAKAAAKEGAAAASTTGKHGKGMKNPSQKDGGQAAKAVTAPEKKVADRAPEKDRKKDAPHPRMQFDDKHRVEKAKRRAVVNQSEARNRVELFRHLPQYVHGTQLPDLESKFFQLDHIHPSVYKVGLQYLVGEISGGNARCIAMLLAFQEAIKDFSTTPEKVFSHDLAAKISSFVSYLIECRPLSISMGNAIRFLKNRIRNLPANLSESEAKSTLQSDINQFISEKIVLADKVIVRHAFTKIQDGDILLTFGSPSVVEMILEYAYEQGKRFRVVIVDSRPKLEGQALLQRLVLKGIKCTYTHINAISYIMHEVTRVFLGAASILSNGTVYSRVGTACVAMVANAFKVPVIICCEAYKFHERVQLDSICSNELGDPDLISKVPGRNAVNYLDSWADNENLQLLNLTYDATPSDYVSMIITDYGMLPPTSVPVIVREYRREKLWI